MKNTDQQFKIDEASGSYKVFIAIKGDDKLKDAFGCNEKGTLYFNGKPMTQPDISEISVYMAKKWNIVPSVEELKMGMMASSKLIKPSISYGTDVSDKMEQDILYWLSKNRPAAFNFEITTEAVAMSIDPEGFDSNRRLLEMKIARVLRKNGLEKARVTYNGKRKVRWFPTSQMSEKVRKGKIGNE
jgi:hypothetical protein